MTPEEKYKEHVAKYAPDLDYLSASTPADTARPDTSALDKAIQAALNKAGQYTNAYGAFGATPGQMNPYATDLKWHGVGYMGKESLVQARRELDALYGKGNYDPAMVEQYAVQLYTGKLNDYTSGRGGRTKTPMPGFNAGGEDGLLSQFEGEDNPFFGGWGKSDNKSLIDAYFKTKGQSQGLGIDNLGKSMYSLNSNKPYGQSYGTDLTNNVALHPKFAGMQKEMGRAGFNDYLKENYTDDEIKQFGNEVFKSHMLAKTLTGGGKGMNASDLTNFMSNLTSPVDFGLKNGFGGGSFIDAYQGKKAEQESKQSVAKLFDDIINKDR